MTGAAPLVDTQSARKQTVVSSDLLQALPTSVRTVQALVALTPGFKGNEGFEITGGYTGNVGTGFHGKIGTNINVDGMGVLHATGNIGYAPNADADAGNGALHERHLGRYQRRRSRGEHDSQGGRQQLLGQRVRPLHRHEPAELQHDRRIARPAVSRPSPASGMSSMRAGPSAGRSRRTGCGSSIRIGTGATSGRPPASTTTSRKARRSTPPTSAGRRPVTNSTSPTPPGSRGGRRSEHKINFFADPQRDCHCPANVANGSPNAPEAFFSYSSRVGCIRPPGTRP